MKRNFYLLTVIDDVYVLGINILLVFGFVFLYQKLESLVIASLPFIFLYGAYGFLVPYVASYIGKLGGRKSIIISMIVLALSSIPMFLFAENENLSYLALWTIFFLVGKLFLHVPFTYNVGRYTEHKDRGRSLSLKRMSIVFVSLAWPAIGGIVSDRFGLEGLMITAAIIFTMGIIPAILLEEFHFKVDYSPKKLEKNVGARKMSVMSFFYFASAISDVFWAPFVFIIVGESFNTLGTIFTVVALINIAIAYVLGKYLDGVNREDFLERSSVLNFIAWIARAFSFNFITVFLADLLYKLNANVIDGTFEVVSYDLMNDRLRKANKDEMVIYRDQIVNYTIAFSWATGAIVASLFGFATVFIVAGVIGLGLLLIK